jgi:hypothetical protein
MKTMVFPTKSMVDMAEQRKRTSTRRTRWQRLAAMDKDILDVEGAATLLGA